LILDRLQKSKNEILNEQRDRCEEIFDNSMFDFYELTREEVWAEIFDCISEIEAAGLVHPIFYYITPYKNLSLACMEGIDLIKKIVSSYTQMQFVVDDQVCYLVWANKNEDRNINSPEDLLSALTSLLKHHKDIKPVDQDEMYNSLAILLVKLTSLSDKFASLGQEKAIELVLSALDNKVFTFVRSETGDQIAWNYNNHMIAIDEHSIKTLEDHLL